MFNAEAEKDATEIVLLESKHRPCGGGLHESGEQGVDLAVVGISFSVGQLFHARIARGGTGRHRRS